MFPFTRFRRAALLFLAPALALWVAGCGSSTEPAQSGQIAMSSVYSTGSSAGPRALTPLAQAPATSGVDSVIVTRVRMALRDITFKTQSDSANFRSSTLVLEPALNTTLQVIALADVPFGTYRRIEFNVHKVKASEVALLPVGERAQFQDFLVDGGKSVIITGRVYKTDGPHEFTFYSALNVNQKIELSPVLELSEGSPLAYVTMKVTAGDWFLDSSGGLLDPLDPADENDITHNISGSIHAFKDTNRDGHSD